MVRSSLLMLIWWVFLGDIRTYDQLNRVVLGEPVGSMNWVSQPLWFVVFVQLVLNIRKKTNYPNYLYWSVFLSMNYSNWEIPQQNTINMVGKYHVLPTKTHDHMDSGCKRWFHLQVSQHVWWFPECLLILLYQKMCTTDFHDSPSFSLPICYQLRNLFFLNCCSEKKSENNWITK